MRPQGTQYRYDILRTLLRQYRRKAKFSQAELARRLSRPQSFVSKYESGERRLDLIEIAQICDALGQSLADFVAAFEEASE
ncbi:MAG TPA: XRE family transcriptional regulator [Phycisphaerales bacterium]|nr:XRE family transcriptional regulator [Phycisphaerales bacterium]